VNEPDEVAMLKMTTRGRVTVPKHVRDAMGLKPRNKVDFEFQSNGIYVMYRVRTNRKSSKGSVRRVARGK
jgi:AbrB family looped-hinge helix DNA binding protein